MPKLTYISALLFIGALSPLLGQDVLLPLDESSFVGFSKNRGAFLDVRVKRSSDLEVMVQAYTGRFSKETLGLKEYKISKISSVRAIIPYLALSPGLKRAFLKKLWPGDQVRGDFLHHKVTYNNETLWTVAQMYTGFGNNYKSIKKVSGLRQNGLRKGMTLKIPYRLLMDLLKEGEKTPATDALLPEESISEEIMDEEIPVPTVSPPSGRESKPPPKRTDHQIARKTPEPSAPLPAPVAAKPQTPRPKPKSSPSKADPEEDEASEGVRAQLAELALARGELLYGKDGKGEAYAQYRLKKGEAIYTAVVVRFCGLVRAQDVNRVAKILINYNHIRDVTDMPIGQPIRIPYTYLEAEFKDPNDSDYLNFLNNMEAVARASSSVDSQNLDGVHVILDAGHGGRDPGADRRRVWEDDYVYDILCRIKARLEKESGAKVISTIIDPSVNYKVQDVTMFRRDRDELLLTTPRYNLSSKGVNTDGVNLRWMLANDRYKKLMAKGTDPDKVIFASFHADALHRSIRGSMVYIPDARHYPDRVSSPGNLRKYAEYGESFRNTRASMQKAQARSMHFASHYVKSSRDRGLRVHRQKPIRSLIYRNPTRPFVPAVLKFNRVPTRVLIEICNLNNPNDQNLLKRPDFRQKVADAFVAAVFRTYGNNARASAASQGTAQPVRGE